MRFQLRKFLLLAPLLLACHAAMSQVAAPQERGELIEQWEEIHAFWQAAVKAPPSFQANFQATTTPHGKRARTVQGTYLRQAQGSDIKTALLLRQPVTVSGVSLYRHQNMDSQSKSDSVVRPFLGRVQDIDLDEIDSLIQTGLNANELMHPGVLPSILFDNANLISPTARVNCPGQLERQCLLVAVQAEKRQKWGSILVHFDLETKSIVEANFLNLTGDFERRIRVVGTGRSLCPTSINAGCLQVPTAFQMDDYGTATRTVVRYAPARPLDQDLSPTVLLGGLTSRAW